MVMTLNAARGIVGSLGLTGFGRRRMAPLTQEGPKKPWETDTGGNGTVPPEVYDRYLGGQATDADLQVLLRAGDITVNQAQEYAAGRGAPTDWTWQGAPGANGQFNIYGEGLVTDPGGNPLPYDINEYAPGGGGGGGYELRSIGGDLYRINPDTGQYELLIPGGGGGSSFDTGPGYLDLAGRKFASEEEQRAFENDLATKGYDLSLTNSDRAELGRRATAGAGMLDFQRNMANDAYARAADPGNFPALLASYAGLEGAAGSPLQRLLGEGFKITADNPYADPRFQNLQDSMYDYGTVPSSADVAGVRDAYKQDAGAADAYFKLTEEQRKALAGVPQLATGGQMTVRRPAALVDLASGKPQAVMGEAGTESVTVAPYRRTPDPRNYPRRGQFNPDNYPVERMSATSQFAPQNTPVPQMTAASSPVDTVREIADANGGTLPQAFYDYTGTQAPTGPNYDVPQAAYTALGKGLQPLGFAPRELIQTLQGGKAPVPGMVASLLQNPRLAPSLREALLSSVRATVGSAGLADFLAEADRYRMRGQNTYAVGTRR